MQRRRWHLQLLPDAQPFHGTILWLQRHDAQPIRDMRLEERVVPRSQSRKSRRVAGMFAAQRMRTIVLIVERLGSQTMDLL